MNKKFIGIKLGLLIFTSLKNKIKIAINAGAAQFALALTRTLSIKIINIIGTEKANKNLFSNSKVNFFIKKSSNLLKKDGLMFVATLNKTFKSYLFAIIGAEYILRWLPINTHDWEKFVKPDELVNLGKKFNLKLKKLNGMKQ